MDALYGRAIFHIGPGIDGRTTARVFDGDADPAIAVWHIHAFDGIQDVEPPIVQLEHLTEDRDPDTGLGDQGWREPRAPDHQGKSNAGPEAPDAWIIIHPGVMVRKAPLEGAVNEYAMHGYPPLGLPMPPS